MPDRAFAWRTRQALQELVVALAQNMSPPLNADAPTNVPLMEGRRPDASTTIRFPGGLAQQGLVSPPLLDNTRDPAFTPSAMAISKTLDILLVDASLRLQAELEAGTVTHKSMSIANPAGGDGIKRGFAFERTGPVIPGVGRALSDFQTPRLLQYWTPYRVAVEALVRRATGQWSERFRQLRTLGLLVLGGSGLFLAGFGLAMYHVAPRRNGIDETAQKSAVLVDTALTTAPHSPVEITTIERSATVTVRSPAPTNSDPPPVVRPTPPEPASPFFAASIPDLTRDMSEPIAGSTGTTELDPASRTNDVNALANSTSAQADRVTALEPGTSETPTLAVPNTAREERTEAVPSQPTADSSPPVPTATADHRFKPESRAWAAAVNPIAPAIIAKPFPRTTQSKGQSRYMPALLTLRDANAVLQVFIALQNRHAVLLNKTPVVRPVDRDGQTWYKLHIGPAVTEWDARATCEGLGAEGQTLGCVVEFHDANHD